MPILAAQSFLTANLNALGQRNADLAEQLAAVDPHPGLIFQESGQAVPAATLDGRQLCSRHRPLDEAERLVKDVDLIEHAVVVVLGFGLGYHVQRLAERGDKATLIVVFEPDLALLRSVLERIDHTRWMRDALIMFITDPTDRGTLARKLSGAEAILAQGVTFLEHPASRARLGDRSALFTSTLKDFVSSAKVTLTTTLMRTVDTVRNLMLNLDHYAGGEGISELRNAAQGYPAVVVSAGPSLHKNMHQLAQPGVRDRCVIIAVQTTLKPLLKAGIKPHFVTALDYHEISKRFYEGLTPEQVQDITLVAEPKANPVILDSFPGPIRCCANSYLDMVLGPMRRPMGELPAGATVAHLAMYLARYLGCDPIAMIGQDLGFPDGLYYAPGAAIHDVWATELNPFNTIAMMEWQRIVRHRLHLHKTKDVNGRSIFTDAQMHAYLQQFERDFAEYKRDGCLIIDATEGGVAKQHAQSMPLADVLERFATRQLPPLPLPKRLTPDAKRLKLARQRLAEVRHQVQRVGDVSVKTASLLRQMLEHQHDQVRMNQCFQKIEQYRKEVEKRFDAFELINQINQLGAFRRMKADRRLHMQRDLDALTRQRAQLERDLDNVTWLIDAAKELADQLAMADRLLAGEAVQTRAAPATELLQIQGNDAAAVVSRVAALVPVDPHRNGLGIRRSLAADFHGRTVLQATLERLGTSKTLESIILIVPRCFDVEPLIDRSRIGLPVEIEWCPEGMDSPFGPEREAIAAARLLAPSCWRGGIAGIGAYDEALCPQIMSQIMDRRQLTAAIIAGPDWPLINVTGEGGCDALVHRHREHPQQHNLVFTQSPPGLCGCLIGASLMREFAHRNRLSTVGGVLSYQPHAPQHDLIARDANVQIEHTVRRSLVRATFDTARQQQWVRAAAKELADPIAATPLEVVRQLENHWDECANTGMPPRHIVLELCANRISCGLFAAHPFGAIARTLLSEALANRFFDELQQWIAKSGADDVALTLAGLGDPLLHPHFDEIVQRARRAGVCSVHVRTELLVEQPTIDRLLASGVDVVSVDLNADREATYQLMMGVNRFKEVLLNIEYLLDRRRRLTQHPGTAAFALPWLVPHLQRRSETYEDIESFYDRWQRMLGTAVIEDPPFGDSSLTPAVTPVRVQVRDQSERMTVLCDGSVLIDELDWAAHDAAGTIATTPLQSLWQKVQQNRRDRIAHKHKEMRDEP